MGLLALVAKGKKSVDDDGLGSDLSNYELSKEEFAFMVSNPKRFTKKNCSRNKNRNW